ncbi:Fic family protein [Nonomuraea sp. NBC_01738]|uniref:oxidoreductase n=1 Tax=Nonomuraea sp. NBC_01738 TaxID=2976003 RepID=UPI002E143CC6|nr:Fic family protein [Nonomuraea sp. NBC_01738]
MSDPLAVIAQLPGVQEAVDEARKAVDRLYRHRVLRRASPAVSAESALRGARASAAIEGLDVPLDALRREEVTNPLVQGALRASAELGRLGSTWRRAPRQVLARLHAVAAIGLTPAEALGRPRGDFGGTAAAGSVSSAGDASPVPPGGDFRISQDFGPAEALHDHAHSVDPRELGVDLDPLGLGPAPSPEEAAARMDGLVSLLETPTKAPALVLAAIVHAELAVIRPFGAADGVVARAAERLTLVEYGLDPKSLVAVEVGHLELPYGDGLRAYLTGTPDGVAEWVRQCASAVTLGVRETTAICEAMQRG